MILSLYLRALRLLRTEARMAALTVAANLALGALALLDPILFGRVIGSLARPGGQAWSTIGLWAALSVVSAGAGVCASVLADRIAHRRRLESMAQAFDNVITLPTARLSERGLGKILQVVFAGGDTLFRLTLGFMREQLPAAFALILLIPIAFWMNPAMASVLLALAAAYVAANTLVIRRTQKGQEQVNDASQAFYGRLGDVVGNVAVIQAYANLKSESERLRTLTRELLKAQFPVLNWWGLLAVLTRSASTLAMVSIFVVGALLAQAHRTNIGEIVSFGGFAGLLISRLDVLSGWTAGLSSGAPALKSFFELLDERGASPDLPDAAPLEAVRGEVRFENVTHWIAGRSDLGVFDLHLHARPGARIALVGASGAGKTTLIGLLQRALDPDLGRITIDGRDISRVTLASLRRSIAVVFQDAGLFNRSIADNLRLARPEATDEELRAALEAAEAWEFVREKPGRLDYVIGERGQLLSGGERQRVAIARAILKDAPILILDEATSALDAITERKVQKALQAAALGRTTFVIAHRLSTIMDADEILVLDRGRIVERGSFEELVAGRGRFARMAEAAGLARGGLEDAFSLA
jgi:ATP-binding cassette subfamily B protein